jgi:hypothetical protein
MFTRPHTPPNRATGPRPTRADGFGRCPRPRYALKTSRSPTRGGARPGCVSVGGRTPTVFAVFLRPGVRAHPRRAGRPLLFARRPGGATLGPGIGLPEAQTRGPPTQRPRLGGRSGYGGAGANAGGVPACPDSPAPPDRARPSHQGARDAGAYPRPAKKTGVLGTRAAECDGGAAPPCAFTMPGRRRARRRPRADPARRARPRPQKPAAVPGRAVDSGPVLSLARRILGPPLPTRWKRRAGHAGAPPRGGRAFPRGDTATAAEPTSPWLGTLAQAGALRPWWPVGRRGTKTSPPPAMKPEETARPTCYSRGQAGWPGRNGKADPKLADRPGLRRRRPAPPGADPPRPTKTWLPASSTRWRATGRRQGASTKIAGPARIPSRLGGGIGRYVHLVGSPAPQPAAPRPARGGPKFPPGPRRGSPGGGAGPGSCPSAKTPGPAAPPLRSKGRGEKRSGPSEALPRAPPDHRPSPVSGRVWPQPYPPFEN